MNAVSPIAHDLRRPGVAELIGGGIATLVFLGAALAGLSNATGRVSDAGVSLALAAADDGSAAVEVTVRNATTAPFRGRLVVGGQDSRDVAVPPGQTQTVQVAAPADCDAPVAVSLEGPGAPAEHIDLPCPEATP